MTDVKLPSDWAIRRVREVEPRSADPEKVIKSPSFFPIHISFARYIEEHEAPPVDPYLKRAREILSEGWGDKLKEEILEGKWDKNFYLNCILKALKETVDV